MNENKFTLEDVKKAFMAGYNRGDIACGFALNTETDVHLSLEQYLVSTQTEDEEALYITLPTEVVDTLKSKADSMSMDFNFFIVSILINEAMNVISSKYTMPTNEGTQ